MSSCPPKLYDFDGMIFSRSWLPLQEIMARSFNGAKWQTCCFQNRISSLAHRIYWHACNVNIDACPARFKPLTTPQAPPGCRTAPPGRPPGLSPLSPSASGTDPLAGSRGGGPGAGGGVSSRPPTDIYSVLETSPLSLRMLRTMKNWTHRCRVHQVNWSLPS